METMGAYPVGEVIDQPLQWETYLRKMKILGLVDLPHFGRGQHAIACIKQLLSVMHGGDIWLENLESINVEIITNITGFPSRGMDPMHFLDEKSREKALA
jgi:hypothetical protein